MQEFLTIAHELADAARPLALKYFRAKGLAVERKDDDSPVTVADREVEAKLRGILAARRPQDGILGEEEGRSGGDCEYTWILDPIDGTKAFTVGRPSFGVLIALWQRGRGIVLGLCDMPATGDRWWSAAGGQVHMNDRIVSGRGTKKLEDAVFACTDPLRLSPREAQLVTDIRASAAISVYGGDCLNYALLASGFIDVIVEARQQLYDIAPFVPMIENAGGRITQMNGDAIGFDNQDVVLCAGTPELHAAVLSLYRNQGKAA